MDLKWKLSNRKVLSSNRIFTLISRDASSPDDKIQGEFYVIETRNWVNVIPITKENKVVLVKQYRHGINDYSLEIPGGIVETEGNSASLQAGQKELQEETGYTSKTWEYLGKASGNPAILNNWCDFFIARDAEKTSVQNFDPHEDIEVIEVDLKELPVLLEQNKIHHPMCVAAIGWYFLKYPISG